MKQINFEYNGKSYCLEYTRETVIMMERRGFKAQEVTEFPMSMLPELFAGAFLAHHRYESRKVIDEILDTITNRRELVGKLSEMYNEPLNAMLNEPEETTGNVAWTANF